MWGAQCLQTIVLLDDDVLLNDDDVGTSSLETPS